MRILLCVAAVVIAASIARPVIAEDHGKPMMCRPAELVEAELTQHGFLRRHGAVALSDVISIEVWLSRDSRAMAIYMRQPIDAGSPPALGLCLLNRLVASGEEI